MFYHKNSIFTHQFPFHIWSRVFQICIRSIPVKSMLPTVLYAQFLLTQHMLLFSLASWLCWWLLSHGQVRSDNHELLSALSTTLHLFFSYFKPKSWLEIHLIRFHILDVHPAFQSFETTWISILSSTVILLIPPGFISF